MLRESLYSSSSALYAVERRACCVFCRFRLSLTLACAALVVGSFGEDFASILWRRTISAYSVMLFDSLISTIFFGTILLGFISGLKERKVLLSWNLAWYVFGGSLEGVSWLVQLYTTRETPEAMQAILRNTSIVWSILFTVAHRLRYRGVERHYRNRFVFLSVGLVLLASVLMTIPAWSWQTLNPSFCLLLFTPVLSAWSHVVQQRGLAGEGVLRRRWLRARLRFNIDPSALQVEISERWHLLLDFALALFLRNATQLLLTGAAFGLNYLPLTYDPFLEGWQTYLSGSGVGYSVLFAVMTLLASAGSVVLDNVSANYHEMAQTFSSPFVLVGLYLMTHVVLWVWWTVIVAVLLLLSAVITWRHWELVQEEKENQILSEDED